MKKNKRIGIWGFGVVGKAAINYFHTQGYQLTVMDKRTSTAQELENLKEKNITWYNEQEQETFFNSCEFIIPSPGINISVTRYATHQGKWLHELDFFYAKFNKPIIAITGSIGKTSTTHLLDQIFKELSIPVAVGGNIGIPTFDLINQQNTVNYALLEVSSFQLNYCTTFTPMLAIWTNFHPNHLDHHATEDEYFAAKNNILAGQTKDQLSLVPFALRNKISPAVDNHKRSYFSKDCPTNEELDSLTDNEQVYYINSSLRSNDINTSPHARPELVEGFSSSAQGYPSTSSGRAQEEINLEISSIQNNTVMRYAHGAHEPIMALTPALFDLSFIDNILLLTAACDLLNLNNQALQAIATTVQLPEHRIEKIGSINNIDFYNDSKATTTASTLAAVKKLHNRPLHLFLGGLSKGVDRTPFIEQLKNQVKHIYCFGKEAESLYAMCIANHIAATTFATLNDAVTTCISTLQSGDCVLLSPAGSSYDLYENYEQRGKHFKELVMQYIENVRILRQAQDERENTPITSFFRSW